MEAAVAMLDMMLVQDGACADPLSLWQRFLRWLEARASDPLEDRLSSADLERLQRTNGLMD